VHQKIDHGRREGDYVFGALSACDRRGVDMSLPPVRPSLTGSTSWSRLSCTTQGASGPQCVAVLPRPSALRVHLPADIRRLSELDRDLCGKPCAHSLSKGDGSRVGRMAVSYRNWFIAEGGLAYRMDRLLRARPRITYPLFAPIHV